MSNVAVIEKMPTRETIRGYKGTLDFYVHKGQACVRKWPQPSPHHTSQKETCNQTRFKLFMKSLKYGYGSYGGNENGALWDSGWRNADYGYRRYMGRTPFNSFAWGRTMPTLKPECPDVNHRLIMHGPSYWQYEVRGGQFHYVDMVFHVDRPNQKMDLLAFPGWPRMKEVWRTERGVLKRCAVQPYPTPWGWRLPLDNGFYGEYPIITHNFAALDGFPWPPGMHVWCTLKRSLLPYPGRETGPTYSVGPMFRPILPPLENAPEGIMLFWPLEPIFRSRSVPSKPYWDYHRGNVIWRPPWMPRVEITYGYPEFLYYCMPQHPDTWLYVNPDYQV